MQEDLAKHGWLSSKISVVWNGVDPERYNSVNVQKQDIAAIRQKYGIPDDWNMLLFVGRLTWVKSVRNLLQAMPLVLKEYPNTKLVILGKGEEQSDIAETAERLNIKANVVYRFDFVPEDEGGYRRCRKGEALRARHVARRRREPDRASRHERRRELDDAAGPHPALGRTRAPGRPDSRPRSSAPLRRVTIAVACPPSAKTTSFSINSIPTSGLGASRGWTVAASSSSFL